MSGPSESLRRHRRRVDQLAQEFERIRHTLAPRERMLTGLIYATRTALAASLGYFVAQGLGLSQGFWAALTAISVAQYSYQDVRSSSRDQFIGAIVGGVIGLGAALLGEDHYAVYAAALMLGMVLCWLWNLGAAGRISGTTTTIIMLVPHSGTAWQVTLLRLGEVAIGACSALLITSLSGMLERRLLGDPAAADKTT